MIDFLKDKVIDQEIDGQPMEDYIANLLQEVDEQKVEKQICDMKISALKQLNNRHKNIIDSQRVMLKVQQFEHDLDVYKSNN